MVVLEGWSFRTGAGGVKAGVWKEVVLTGEDMACRGGRELSVGERRRRGWRGDVFESCRGSRSAFGGREGQLLYCSKGAVRKRRWSPQKDGQLDGGRRARRGQPSDVQSTQPSCCCPRWWTGQQLDSSFYRL